MSFEKLLALVVALVLLPLGAAAEERLVSLGLAKDSAWSAQEHRQQMVEHNLLNHAVVFYDLMAAENRADPYAWVKREYHDRNINIVLTLIIDAQPFSHEAEAATPAGNLGLIADGFYDDELKRLAAVMADYYHPVIIRPLHEADGNWYPWGMYAEGNTVKSYVAAFAHVVGIFREAGVPAVFELNLNRRDGASPPGVLTDIDRWFTALDPYVDMYAISTYNRCKTSAGSYKEWRSFTEEFAPAYQALARYTTKPINVAEVATTDLCGPRLPWYVNMLDDIEEQFTQVEMVTFYFGTVPVGKASNDIPIEWGFPTDSQREAFGKVIELWQEHLLDE